MRKLVFYLSMFGAVLAPPCGVPSMYPTLRISMPGNPSESSWISSGRRLRHVFPIMARHISKHIPGKSDGGWLITSPGRAVSSPPTRFTRRPSRMV